MTDALQNPTYDSDKLPKPRPFLKWAGGKSQLLNELNQVKPRAFNQYIEPFIGGAAFFFDINPKQGIISDLNPELINVYKVVRDQVEALIAKLSSFKNTEKDFYAIREKRFDELDEITAAARTIFLNRTCFNGLYRVNKSGHFNSPYGKNPKANFVRANTLRSASNALQDTKIILGDYKHVLRENARAGDFVFLDPPYLPVSEYSDFKRYTKERFDEEDHAELADEVRRLQKLGCHVVLTNSNNPLITELYEGMEIAVHSTRRNISSKAGTRKGQDVIVTAKAHPRFLLKEVPSPLSEQARLYPSTRYMGSKEKLLPHIQNIASRFEFDTVADLFSGSGVVSYMFKSMGKQVFANDYMAMGATFTKAMVENNSITLSDKEIDKLFLDNPSKSSFIQDTFEGLYYTDEENKVIDLVRANIKKIRNPYKRAIAMSALIRACVKKRARGIFTYTGLRYDDGRADLRMSMEEQIRRAAALINESVFDNGYKGNSRRGDAMTASFKPDLVYLDPPYYSPLSDNEYVRRYHFVEGLACDWKGVQMQEHLKTKKFKNYPTPFSTRLGSHDAFDKLFKRLKDSIILLSYSSNSLPTKDELIALMGKYKAHIEVQEINYRYSFANQGHKKSDNRNTVKEYLFVGY